VILDRTLDLLESVYDPVRAEFPIRIRMSSRGYEPDYGGRDASRYSINCLLGLQEARRQGVKHSFLAETDELICAFVERHRSGVTRCSDLGLLVALIAEDPCLQDCASETISRLRDACSNRRSALFSMQDLGWMLWGSVAAARAGMPGADSLSHGLIDRMASRYVVEATALPRHSLNPLRAWIVSFGSIAYFLKAVHDYWAWCGGQHAWELFVRGARAAARLQQTDGAWPWLVSASNARVLSRYPLFSVHQLSMAMFFLLPARRLGIIESEAPIAASFAWVTGANEVRQPLFSSDPFLIFRSAAPQSLWPRAQRYVSALQRSVLRDERDVRPSHDVFIDTASHSYEWGWLLQAWSEPESRALLRRLWGNSVT
jgi:hypothetical protein